MFWCSRHVIFFECSHGMEKNLAENVESWYVEIDSDVTNDVPLDED